MAAGQDQDKGVRATQWSEASWRSLACPLLVAGLTATWIGTAASAQQDDEDLEAIRSAIQLLDVLMPAGAVVAFNREECPPGWELYLPARGRFIRGIDPEGERDPDGVRELGSYQADALQAHRHAVDEGGIPGLFDSTDGTGPDTRAAAPSYENRNRHLILEPTDSPAGGEVRTSTETRPGNVALLYCERLDPD